MFPEHFLFVSKSSSIAELSRGNSWTFRADFSPSRCSHATSKGRGRGRGCPSHDCGRGASRPSPRGQLPPPVHSKGSIVIVHCMAGLLREAYPNRTRERKEVRWGHSSSSFQRNLSTIVPPGRTRSSTRNAGRGQEARRHQKGPNKGGGQEGAKELGRSLGTLPKAGRDSDST